MLREKPTLILVGLIFFCMTGPGIMTVFAMDNTATPVDVYVDDQRIVDARVVIKQVDSYGPGWLAIHTLASDGTLGPVIGYTAVCDGMNAYLPVAIDMNKVKPNLVAALHVDRGVVGIFEFPGSDTVAHVGAELITTAFTASF